MAICTLHKCELGEFCAPCERNAGAKSERDRWMRYAAVLTAELEELIPEADSRGWRSHLYRKGKRMREELGVTEEEIRQSLEE